MVPYQSCSYYFCIPKLPLSVKVAQVCIRYGLSELQKATSRL